ncbi:MAG: NAD(P)H-hydrate dehydratase [Candidatus ainarchaeum sp.]|nr:NAD(P)H-hydrate dehydratase [Candidatus ainarchaeum sp.]
MGKKALPLYVPPKGSHKGENGKVLIVAGGSRYHGAAVFCVLGARRFADMVYFMPGEMDEKLLFAVSGIPEAVVVNELPEADCVLAGPGLGNAALNLAKLRRKYAKVVLDGDAFKQVEGNGLRGCVITPHEGEFRALFGMDGSPEHVRAMAEKWGCTILKKGHVDVVSDGRRIALVKGGNAGLTKGGTGDVLAGLLCALYAKNGAMEAAVAASRANKGAGELLFKEKGYAYCASDVAERLPETVRWR